jgi:hypothetical protein
VGSLDDWGRRTYVENGFVSQKKKGTRDARAGTCGDQGGTDAQPRRAEGILPHRGGDGGKALAAGGLLRQRADDAQDGAGAAPRLSTLSTLSTLSAVRRIRHMARGGRQVVWEPGQAVTTPRQLTAGCAGRAETGGAEQAFC